jgi:NAD(P)-dependent dehydrogenase (short-subunit alcohol dehydrogenase family)
MPSTSYQLAPRIFITGGASGLGKAIALKFARKGYRVCIADINEQRGQEVLMQLQTLGSDAFYLHCNVTQLADLENAKQQLVKRWQGVDIVVNNAGIGGTAGEIEAVPLSVWHDVLDINLMGVVRGCKVFSELFKQQNSGYFINIASAAGLLNAPHMSGYNAAKAGVISLSETLVYELASANIGVTLVCPAFFKTNLTESVKAVNAGVVQAIERLMARSSISADDIAEAIFQAFKKKQFWLLTHKSERKLWLLKRYLPFAILKWLAFRKMAKLFTHKNKAS